MGDPDFQNGDYLDGPRRPNRGLAVARRLGHITYLSPESMRRKFDRERHDGEDAPMTFADDFEVERYLDHQGESFVQRFDALSYLYLTRLMDYFDPFNAPDLRLERVTTRFLAISFDSDWRFGSEHSRHLVDSLRAGGADARHAEVSSPWGHDSFLLDVPEYHRLVARALGDEVAPRAPLSLHG